MSEYEVTPPGNRMSSLPIAFFCGLAPSIDTSSGPAAVQSSAFHAKMAGDPKWEALWARLTDEQREECESWQTPTDVQVGEVALRFEDAITEMAVGLTESLRYCPPDDPTVLLSRGHVDFHWKPVEVGGMKVVYLGDAKRTAFTADLWSLQLDAYGFALAEYYEADGYAAGLWILEDGEWRWRSRIIDLHSVEAAEIAEHIHNAMTHKSYVGTTGSHCRDCYGRMHCPAHLIPATALVRQQGPGIECFAEGGQITKDNAFEALRLYQAAQDLTKQMKSQIEAWAHANGGIRDGEGKIWKQVTSKGKGTRVDTKRLLRDHPDLAEQYTVPTKPRSMGFRWCNE